MKFLSKILGKKRVFLDYASTTPVDREVGLVMKNSEKYFANPSALYAEALMSKSIVEDSKKAISEILNCQKHNIVFTSGGTESNNLALLGLFESYKSENFVPHFITTNIEHPAILEVCNEIKRRGGEVTIVSVDENGLVKVRDIEESIKDNTVLVSVMYANNEIGTVQSIKEIGRAIKEYRRKKDKPFPYFHSDACQAALYHSLDTLRLNLDMMTLDGIKMYGPRGSGVLYVRDTVKISPVLFGGGQQNGKRSGTENLASIVGFAKALELSEKLKAKESERLQVLRDYTIEKILKEFPGSSLNGHSKNRLPNNINICFPGIDAEFVTISLDVSGFAVSYSSSCRTLKEDSSSYVVEALGKKDCKLSSLRISLGRESSRKDLDKFILALKKVIK